MDDQTHSDSIVSRLFGWTLCLVFAVLTFPVPARADEVSHFVRLTCSPEIRFFQASRIRVDNIPYGGELLGAYGATKPLAMTKLAQTRSIYGAPVLAKVPFVCRVPGKLHDSRNNGYYPPFYIRVQSKKGSYVVDIAVNGKPIGSMDLNSAGPWFSIQSISVSDDGVGTSVEICQPKEIPSITKEISCSWQYLKVADQRPG